MNLHDDMGRRGEDLPVTNDELFEQLLHLAEMRRALDRIEVYLISYLRQRGVNWGAMGEELGLTRQGAQARYEAAWKRMHNGEPTPEGTQGQ
jgi:hypothetical protein